MNKYSVEFRIEGMGVSPTQITSEICLRPCSTRDVGEPRGKSGTNDKGLWSFDGNSDHPQSPREWESLEDGLLYVIEQLRPKLDRIRNYSSRHDVYWWCGSFQDSFDGGPTFSPLLLSKLAEFGIPLILTNYFSPRDSD